MQIILPEIWRKINDQSIESFHQEVERRILDYSALNIDVEAKWLNADSSLCNDDEIKNSTLCILVEKKKEEENSFTR